MLSLMMAREEYGWYLTFVLAMVDEQWKGHGFPVFLVQLLSLPIIYFICRSLKTPKLQKHKTVIIIVYYELIQLLHYKWAIQGNHEDAFEYLQGSTIVLMSNEISPILPWPVNLFLVVKHITFWYWFHLGSELMSKLCIGNVIMIFWLVYHMYTYTGIRKHILESEFAHIQSLRRKEEQISALYDTLPCGVLVLTEHRKIVSYNSVLLEFLDLHSPQNAEAKVYEKITKLQYVPEYTTSESCLEAPILTDILTFLLSSQKSMKSLGVVLINEKYLEWRAKKLDWEDARSCIICVRDITSWVQLQHLAKQESDNKSALLRSVSHELRTPTNAIINLALDVQAKEELSPESKKDMTMLSSASQFLLSVTNDLLDYSSITNGKFGLTKQFFPLENAILECTKLIELQCKHKGLELSVRYDPLLPKQAYNDKNRLKQVILNLLSNALKFTRTGKIEVVAVSVSDTSAGIKVIDTGVGIRKESIGTIFTQFGKLAGNEKLNPTGCGLGLSISSMLVRLMGGSNIEVSSTLHVGSVFSFEFNIADTDVVPDSRPILSDSLDLQEAHSPILFPSHSSSSLPDLLIADDVDFNRIVLKKMLRSAGYDCDEAVTGVQVLQLVTARANRGKPYLVILMDVEMPEMDGITATRELVDMVNRGELESFPVVIGCSAYSSTEDREMCMRAGMRHYIEKPVPREQLFDILSRIVP